MPSSFPKSPVPVDSVVIKDSSSGKPTTTLLHSSSLKNQQHYPHLCNYWTLNERLRSRNEKLVRKQQTSCRLAFCSLWLFIFAGVMIILIYRFTDDCSIITTDRKQFIPKCLRHSLYLTTLCLGFLAFSGILFGTCRYFRSQPKPFLHNNDHKLQLTQNYDVVPTKHSSKICCCRTKSTNGASSLPSQQISNHNDEHSNVTVISSVQNISPQRKIPPFTYEELPPTTQPLSSSLSIVNQKSKTSNRNSNKSAFFSSSTSTSSSPQSNISTTLITHTPINARTSNNNNKRKSTLNFEDAYPSTPTSYTTCVCVADVWERQKTPTTPLSPH